MITKTITVRDTILDGPELKISISFTMHDGSYMLCGYGTGYELRDVANEDIMDWIPAMTLYTGAHYMTDPKEIAPKARELIHWILDSWIRPQMDIDPSFTMDDESWTKIAMLEDSFK